MVARGILFCAFLPACYAWTGASNSNRPYQRAPVRSPKPDFDWDVAVEGICAAFLGRVDATKATLVTGACLVCLWSAPPHASAAVPARPSAADWVGGYTVAGTKLSLRPGTAPGPPESFRVPQECLCSATATEHGIFARGANPGNAFLLLATRSDAGEWTAEQTSVGAAPPYKATMRFGSTAGGAHTAVGSTLNSRGVTTAFSAEQSAIGCHEGEGAAACEAVCGKHGLSWDMIRQRCGL